VERSNPIPARASEPTSKPERNLLTLPRSARFVEEAARRASEAWARHRAEVTGLARKAATVLGYLGIALLIFLAYGSVPNRWYKVITIEGNSMSPTLRYGDLIVISRPPRAIEEGTIVTLQVESAILTHRFIGYDENGRRVFKGDANAQPDDFSETDYSIVGVYRFRIPLLGHLNIQANRALRPAQAGPPRG